MIIRPAREKDIPEIVRLGRILWDIHVDFDNEYYALEESFGELFASWVREQLFASYQFLYVAEDETDGKITGFIAGFLKSLFPWFKTKTVGHISYLIIDPAYRRLKIGQKLEEAAKNWFISKNIRYVELYVEEKNDSGQSAWNHYGFGPFKKFLRKTLKSANPSSSDIPYAQIH